MNFLKKILRGSGAEATAGSAPVPISARYSLKPGTTCFTVCSASELQSIQSEVLSSFSVVGPLVYVTPHACQRRVCLYGFQGIPFTGTGLTVDQFRTGPKLFRWEPFGLLNASSVQEKHNSFPVVLEISTQAVENCQCWCSRICLGVAGAPRAGRLQFLLLRCFQSSGTGCFATY